jgi:hypothetical protein
MKILALHLSKYNAYIINIMKTDHTTISECIHTSYLSKYSNIPPTGRRNCHIPRNAVATAFKQILK